MSIDVVYQRLNYNKNKKSNTCDKTLLCTIDREYKKDLLCVKLSNSISKALA